MAQEPSHVLVVDDDTRLSELLQRYLGGEGYRVTTAGDAAEARAKLAALTFDILIVDIMMPGEGGLELTAALRAESDVPILLLTAMGETEDRIAGLARGADDYLAKPFEPRELVLRLNAILRRVPRAAGGPGGPLALGALAFDPVRGELAREGARVRLTGAEAALLSALARRPGEPVAREALRAEGRLGGSPRSVDVQITRLRRKIEPDPRNPRYLRTVRGTGYVLLPD